jgi:hypothetical protein
MSAVRTVGNASFAVMLLSLNVETNAADRRAVRCRGCAMRFDRAKDV